MNATDDAARDRVTPQDIKLKREEGCLSVTWKDGHTSNFDLAFLRKNCPCAACNAEREKQAKSTELFPILKSDPGTGPPRAVGANLIGNYALQIRWSDGHDTGMYDFRTLRAFDDEGHVR